MVISVIPLSAGVNWISMDTVRLGFCGDVMRIGLGY